MGSSGRRGGSLPTQIQITGSPADGVLAVQSHDAALYSENAWNDGTGGAFYATQTEAQAVGVHTPGDKVDGGVHLLVGDDLIGVYLTEKDSDTVQFHEDSSGAVAIEFAEHNTASAPFRFVNDNGEVSLPSLGVDRKLAAAPLSPIEGEKYYNTVDHKNYVWNATAWKEMAPAGAAQFDEDTYLYRLKTGFTAIGQEDPLDGSEAKIDIEFGTIDAETDDGSGNTTSEFAAGGEWSITAYRGTDSGYVDVDGGSNGHVDMGASGYMVFGLPIAGGFGSIDGNRFIFVGGWGMTIPKVAADPSGAQLVESLFWYNETDHKWRGYDGTAVIDLDGPGTGGAAITVQDEGTPLATALTTMNFVGAGVTAIGAGATKTITIPGGGSPASSAAGLIAAYDSFI